MFKRIRSIDWDFVWHRILCAFQIHLKTIKGEYGFTCTTCGYFKDRAMHQADQHAGGGW